MSNAAPVGGPAESAHTHLREALSLFVTGVTVISVRDPDTGQPRGMTANAFMSGSLEPPLVVVSVRHTAKLHPLLEREGYYGVSILADGMEREARRFAGIPLSDHEPAPRFRWLGNVPVLHDALATLTARVDAAHVVGDHTLFVGAVGAVEFPEYDGASPLAYLKSRFVRVTAPEGVEPLPIDPWSGAVDAWG